MLLAATGLTTQIYNNHLKSAVLLAGFPLLLILMTGAFFGGLDMLGQGRYGGATDWGHVQDAAMAGIAQYGGYAFGFAGLWFVVAYFFHGSMMRMATGSQPITRQQMPRIYNMLENLCISRGIPMPQFEVIDSPALNAFATGLDQKSYRIVLTRGIIEKLSDDELEGVIAHELTHIMNRDVRLLIVSVVFVGMISFFAQMAFRMLVHGGRPNYYRSRSDREGRNNNAAVLMLAAAILAVGYIFAIAIRFALSRKREYLADAGAVTLTRNPEAMMRALLRISGNDTIQGMPNEVQQMCIENSHDFLGIFATHPAIKDRIKALSTMTNTPVPDLPVTLRRAPSGPWTAGIPSS
jgi:heat shock protein HtpX